MTVAAIAASARATQAKLLTLASPRFALSLLTVIVLHSAVLMPWVSSMRSHQVLPAQPSMSVRLLAASDNGAATSVPLGGTLPAAALASSIDVSPVAVTAPNQREIAQPQSAELTVYPAASTLAGAAVRAAAPADAFAANRPVSAASTELTATKADAKKPLSEPVGLPQAPSYFSAGTLDPGPKPLNDINPDYPARAGQQQGLVVLRLLINEKGVVDNVAVVRSAPAGYFEESALLAFGTALFSPGKLLGLAVKSQITVEVEFMPINRGATVSGRTY